VWGFSGSQVLFNFTLFDRSGDINEKTICN
jgi:hypothetical protein